jgi:hypothetical protein
MDFESGGVLEKQVGKTRDVLVEKGIMQLAEIGKSLW